MASRGENIKISNVNDIERFFKFIRVNNESACWEWQGKLKKEGYGNFTMFINGKWVTFYSHRVSYSVFNGYMTPGLVIDHICRNRSCVNPDHLREVSIAINCVENSMSPISANKLKTHCSNGHEFSPKNTIYRKDNGGRQCKECKKMLAKKNNFKRRRGYINPSVGKVQESST